MTVILPLGAEAKMHGLHLPLSTDLIQAQECANKVALKRNVIIAPSINYGYYPLFVKYGGSTTLSSSTAIDMIVDIVRGLSDFGAKRFYIINQGISTTPSLKKAAEILADEGILLYYSDFSRGDYHRLELSTATKPIGGHADEIETSNVLSIRPDLVDMRNAEDDTTVIGKKGFPTPVPLEGGILNPSGVKGYSKPATKEKGKKYMESFSELVAKDVDSVSQATMPVAKDFSKEFVAYEGNYVDTNGRKLMISQKNNRLYYVWNNRDLKNFFSLRKITDDYFSAFPLQILFVQNENGEVVKAWCRDVRTTFWVTKTK
jgi:creatinine amidohydrolase